jgi:hypothetical protein
MQPKMSEQSTQRAIDKAKPPKPTRAQRLAAFGFLGAFALTILTVLLTGLKVGAPSARHVLQPAPRAAESRLPSPQAEAPTGSASAAPPAQPVQAPGVGEPRTNDDSAREDAATRDSGDATRKDSPSKDSRKDKDADGSRADDAR